MPPDLTFNITSILYYTIFQEMPPDLTCNHFYTILGYTQTFLPRTPDGGLCDDVQVTVVRFQEDGLANTDSMLDTEVGVMPSLSQVSQRKSQSRFAFHMIVKCVRD